MSLFFGRIKIRINKNVFIHAEPTFRLLIKLLQDLADIQIEYRHVIRRALVQYIESQKGKQAITTTTTTTTEIQKKKKKENEAKDREGEKESE